jgi:hypothetical protein
MSAAGRQITMAAVARASDSKDAGHTSQISAIRQPDHSLRLIDAGRPPNARVLLRANHNKAPASEASRRSPTDRSSAATQR